MGKMADQIKEVAGKLGVNIPEDKMPTEEFVQGEMKELQEIELFLYNASPQVVKGCIYFMSKGASFREAAAVAFNAKKDMESLEKIKTSQPKKEEIEVQEIGAMVNV